MDRSQTLFGKSLFEALTQEEIVELLDILFDILPIDFKNKTLVKLKPDTRQTVRQILFPDKSERQVKETKTSPISTAKLQQTWSELWQEWFAVVEKAAQEEGEYIKQEERWEQPYFDESAFVEDLEKVAKKMHPLLPVAFQNGFSPDEGFAQALLDAEDEVAEALPDWMEVMNGFGLGKTLTTCLLEWEWLKIQKKKQNAFDFAQRILDWEGDFSYVFWDDDTFLDFFDRLSKANQEVLYRGLDDARGMAPWDHCLKETHSHWHNLYMYFAESQAPEQYLDSLKATISQQWQNGLPVIKDLLAKKDYVQSLQVVEDALAVLLKSHQEDQVWTPETSLLFPIVSRFFHSGHPSDIKTLLRYYQQTAKALEQTQRVQVLEIQRTAFNHFFDWEWMVKVFKESAVPENIRLDLFQSWRDHIVDRTKPQHGLGSEKKRNLWWLDWLIEGVFDAQKGAPYFQKQIDQWLAQLPEKMKKTNRTSLGWSRIWTTFSEDEDQSFLRLLTKDLTEICKRGKSAYPTFYQVVIRPGGQATSDEKFRQKYLKVFVSDDLLDRVITLWKEHLHIQVPDPKNVSNADYTSHAQWMAALKELAPDSYQALLKTWRVEHERRRNLWQAMEQKGLDGLKSK